jgi:CheY-like chemotaxis protein
MSSEQLRLPSPGAMTKPRPILVVDDEPVILEMLQDVLTDEGFAVVTANNGPAALYLLQRTMVALALIDFMMPHLNGIELAEQMRRDPHTAGIPLLLMSAAPPSDIGTHFAAVIAKPFEIETLVRLVRQFGPS